MNIISHLNFLLFFLLFSWGTALVPTQAAGSTSIILLQGQSKDVEMLFAIERATPVAQGLVTIRKANDATLTISADAPGSTSIDVLGVAGERHQISVVIQKNLQRIMSEFENLVPPSVIVSPLPLLGKLRAEGTFRDRKERADFLKAMAMFEGMVVDQTSYSEMDEIKRSLETRLPRGVIITHRPELNIIELDGVITSPREWTKFQNILGLYQGVGVKSIVQHEPGPEIYASLRDDLTRAGVPMTGLSNFGSGLRIVYKRELNAIVVEGDLGSEDHWLAFRDVMGLYEGQGVRSMVKYEPGPEAMWSLKQQLENEGFAVTTDSGTDRASTGVIRLHYNRGVLNVSGSFDNPAKIKHIERIVHSQPYLTVAGGEGGSGGGGVRAVLHLEFAEEEFEVNLAFYQVGATHARNVGLNLAERGWPEIDLMGLITRKRGDTSTTREAEYRMTGLMGGSINFSNGTSPGKLTSGTMLNVRTGTGPQSFHNGGTLIIPVSGQLGSTAGVSQIEHGIRGDIEASMGVNGEVELSINASLTAVPTSFGPAYNQETLANFQNVNVRLPVGYSRVAGGHQIMDASRRRTGVPGANFAGLRDRSDFYEERHIVMLVSVHRAGQTQPQESALSKLFQFVPERAEESLGVIETAFLHGEPHRKEKLLKPLNPIKYSESRMLPQPPKPSAPSSNRVGGRSGNWSRR